MGLSAITQQLSTSHCEGTPFSTEKQQIIGKSCALTTAASVTAMGEQQDLGTEVFWAWEWSGDSANTGDGEGAQREPCSAGHGAARKWFYCEKSRMVLLLFRGSPVLEFGDGLGSSAAVIFMFYGGKIWVPQLSRDVGEAGSPPPPQTPSGPLDYAPHNGNSCIPAKHQIPFSTLLAPLSPCPQISPRALHCLLTPCFHPGELVAFGVTTATTPPAQPATACRRQTQAGHPGPGHGGDFAPRVWGGGRVAGIRTEPGTAVAKQPLDGSVSPRQRC